MAVNFCQFSLGTRIICSTVSTENHEPENLISENFTERNRGYLAGSFVRPPVDIILQFPCPIIICCMAVNGRVGSQISTGYEILTQITKPDSYDAFNSGMFTLVGRFTFDSTKKGLYVTKSPHPPECKSFCEDEAYVKENLKSLKQHLSNVWSLRLRINKTHGSSIPALASWNVWGYVAYSSSPTSARRLLSIWHSKVLPKYDKSNFQSSETANNSHEASVNSSHRDLNVIEPFEIPEEFLDSLTFDIMSIPVRLPSGNVIDEQTLERFNEQEAIWGRPPSDPFTGQPITAERRPVYDVALKARIDTFLLKESHRPCLQNVPRTLGGLKTRSNHNLLGSLSNPYQNDSTRPFIPEIARSSTNTVDETNPSRRSLASLASNLQQLASRVEPKASSAVKHKSLTVSPAICPCGGQNGFASNQGGRLLLYLLPCSHHICRPCLLEMKSDQAARNIQQPMSSLCRRCREPFLFHEVVLYHGR